MCWRWHQPNWVEWTGLQDAIKMTRARLFDFQSFDIARRLEKILLRSIQEGIFDSILLFFSSLFTTRLERECESFWENGKETARRLQSSFSCLSPSFHRRISTDFNFVTNSSYHHLSLLFEVNNLIFHNFWNFLAWKAIWYWRENIFLSLFSSLHLKDSSSLREKLFWFRKKSVLLSF